MGSFSGYGFEKKCCPHVVNPKALALLLLAIPLATTFLIMQVNDGRKRKKRRRRRRGASYSEGILEIMLDTANDFVQSGTKYLLRVVVIGLATMLLRFIT